jgi:hypothetical protein
MPLFDGKPNRLTKIKVKEISLVDRPASPGACVILAKSRDGEEVVIGKRLPAEMAEPIEKSRLAEIVEKAMDGTADYDDLLEARRAGIIGYELSTDEAIEALQKFAENDEEIGVEKMSKNIDLVEVIKTCRANPRVEGERFAQYIDRVFKSELPLEAKLVAKDMFDAMTHRRLITKHDDRRRDVAFAKRAADTIETLAKSMSAEQGISYAQAFTAACKQNPDLYRQAAKAGAFEKAERDYSDGQSGGTLHHSESDRVGAQDSDESEDEQDVDGDESGADDFERARSFYTPSDITRQAEHHDFDDIDAADITRIKQTADKLVVEAAASGRRMSRQSAVAKSYGIHSSAYQRLRGKGWDGSIDD